MRLDRFQKLALATTLATYVLIGVGGLVRAAGAGLGCPDWPRCFDRWYPPFDASGVPAHIDPALFNFAKAWTEYLNRLLGVAVGFLIFATLVAAVVRHRRTPRVLWPTVLAFLFVGFEGWLGGMVVRSQLRPIVLTAHLVFALLVVSLLLYATVSAFFPSGKIAGPIPDARVRLGRATLAVMVLVLVQAAFGALVRGEIQLLAEASGEAGRAGWLAQVGLLDVVHRNLAVLTTLAVLGLAWWVRRQAIVEAPLLTAVDLSVWVTITQVLAGLGLAYLGFPRVLQVLHLWAGSILLGCLTVLGLLVYRLDPRGAVEPSPALG
ncbi:MAG: COX15/CtaA family protein [Deltaproteobacteria bacterium]|jgi:cytochrome c oxidase assembly protein subunit 15|nr:COX15/CtaA family protein [Deltaproteobacteria bacterium]